MEVILQVFYSVFSGLLLSLAIPNEIALLGIPYLTLIALIPLYFAFTKCKSYWQSFAFFFIQTMTTHLASSFWLANFKDFAVLTLGASAIGTGFIGGFFGLFMFLPFSFQSRKFKQLDNTINKSFFRTTGFRILYFAVIYTVYEWVKSTGFLGYPWGTLSSTIFKWPVLMQLSAVTGTYGITFLLALINPLVYEGFIFIWNYFSSEEKNNYQYNLDLCSIKGIFCVTAVFFCFSLIYGTYEYYRTRQPQKLLTAVIVQQNSDPWKQESDSQTILESEENTKKEIQNMKEQGQSPDIVIWSEGTLTHYFPDSYDFYTYYPSESPLIPFIKEIHTPLLSGGVYIGSREKRKYYNAALLFDKEGQFRGFYGKNHLVPFAEAIPFVNVPKIGDIITKLIGISAGWTPGDQYTYFDIPGTWVNGYSKPLTEDIDISRSYYQQKSDESRKPLIKACAPICYDDAFTDIMRPLHKYGAELYLNISDDSWSLTKSSEYQHFVIASYRAIEYRTTLVRATNAGVSAVIAPSGKVLYSMPLFKACAISADIPVFEWKETTYSRLGNYIPWTFIFLLLGYAFYEYKTFSGTDYIPSERNNDLSKKSKKKKHRKK